MLEQEAQKIWIMDVLRRELRSVLYLCACVQMERQGNLEMKRNAVVFRRPREHEILKVAGVRDPYIST